jgi:hypothetical protein
MLFKERIRAYSENHTELVHKKRRAKRLLKQVVYVVTTGLERIKYSPCLKYCK